MNYPQPAHPTPKPPKVKRWPWILGIAVAFVLGIVIGSAGKASSGSNTAGPTATVQAPASGGEAKPEQAEAPPPAPAGPATTMDSGTYQVGVDVQAGQYKTAGPPEGGLGCYWARLKDDSGSFDSIIANGNLEGQGSVTTNDGEFIQLSGDCSWNKVG